MKRGVWYWLLLIPFVALLWIPSYAKLDPAFFGIPFFYWYQILWIALNSLVIGVVLLLTRDRSDV
jgi:hypothetical protein